ncbi:hypothetical protein RRG08_010888 [Elysia crispata]|uniref:MULE transposase domain-containing protein n=1 Tax=Elysia crispata TaxID=231223 RepID=A0AAE0YVC2_9GAST|nr:hypothetical protein RRG08_010888 [Elysia crispata]
MASPILSKYTTKFGNSAPLIEGFKFILNRKNSATISWKCANWKEKCPARCLTDHSLTTIFDLKSDHNHTQPPCHSIAKQDLQNRCKKRSLHNTDERPAKVIIQELQADKVDIVPREYSSIRKAIYIARRSVKPKLPRDIDETIHVLEEGNFDKPDDFTYATKNKVVMMTFEKNYQYFTNDSPLFGDGTFKCSPQFFFQLYIFHVERLGYYMPMFYFLLPNKKQETYEVMLGLLIDECQKRGLIFSPSRINLDFESATHQAFKKVFPEIDIFGCNFHLKQAWLRKCNELGLKKDYEDKESEIHKWMRILFGMPFLPSEQVIPFFCIEATCLSPIDPRIEELEEYLLKNYIESQNLPPSMWASQDLSRPRTTNCCESFHAHFQKFFQNSNPNIFTLINRLGDVQQLTLMKFSAISKGENAKTRKRDRCQRERWEKAIQEFREARISRVEYVNKMSYKLF